MCLGKATKVCDLLTDKNKEYVAVMLLGKVTDTQDVTGTVLEEHPVEVSEEQVKEAIEKAGLTVVEINHQGEWVNITAQKR